VNTKTLPFDTVVDAESWHVPLFVRGRLSLQKVLSGMGDWKLHPKDVPFIIKLVENPKYDVGLFAGNVSLFSHDCIHVVLGRGLLPKDEAFVIGFTMGSTKKMFRWRKGLFAFCAKYLYPEGYKFCEEERLIFNIALEAGKRCPTDLSKFDFKKHKHHSLDGLRSKLGIDKNFLRYCYEFEKKCFPDSLESQRVI
jgi:hypothetical protein